MVRRVSPCRHLSHLPISTWAPNVGNKDFSCLTPLYRNTIRGTAIMPHRDFQKKIVRRTWTHASKPLDEVWILMYEISPTFLLFTFQILEWTLYLPLASGVAAPDAWFSVGFKTLHLLHCATLFNSLKCQASLRPNTPTPCPPQRAARPLFRYLFKNCLLGWVKEGPTFGISIPWKILIIN